MSELSLSGAFSILHICCLSYYSLEAVFSACILRENGRQFHAEVWPVSGPTTKLLHVVSPPVAKQ